MRLLLLVVLLLLLVKSLLTQRIYPLDFDLKHWTAFVNLQQMPLVNLQQMLLVNLQQMPALMPLVNL